MVGLTGGIGAGKSAVAGMLAARGAYVVDADRIAREVVEPRTPGLLAVTSAFGPEVLGPDGALDRARLGALVFSDEAARRRLEAIVHPLVAERSGALLAAAPPDAVAVYDVPLLAENDMAGRFDLVVVVDAPEEVRLDRLVRLRGMAPEAARARLAAQADPGRRLALADVVVDNSGTLADTERQVGDLWDRLAALAGGRPTAGSGERVERTPDGHHVVVDGRRWRASDPELPPDVHAALRRQLMSARRDVGVALRSGDGAAERAARDRVHRAKLALGERGTPWWEQTAEERRARWEAGLDTPAGATEPES